MIRNYKFILCSILLSGCSDKLSEEEWATIKGNDGKLIAKINVSKLYRDEKTAKAWLRLESNEPHDGYYMKDIVQTDSLLEIDCQKSMGRVLEVIEVSKDGERSQYVTSIEERKKWTHTAPESEEDIIQNYMCNYLK